MIYLYGIKKQPSEPIEGIRGIDFAPLQAVGYEQLAAIVSESAPHNFEPLARRLWQHEHVVESLMVHESVVPARFATTFPDGEAVRRYLEVFKEVIVHDLNRINGCVELSLNVVRLWGPGSGDGAVAEGEVCFEVQEVQKPGRAFDMARRSAAMQRNAYAERDVCLGTVLSRSLEAVAVDAQVDVNRGNGVVLKASYLVSRTNLGEMQDTVRLLMKTYPDLQFLCTGPWPPYHFVHSLV